MAEEHHDEGLSRDWGFTLPDEVWEIPEDERDAQARYNDDLCQWGDRFFIRCILPVPLKGEDDFFGWGAWAEVEAEVFERYLDLYEADGRDEPPLPAKLANRLAPYPGTTLGTRLLIQFQDPDERPILTLQEGDKSRLAQEQRDGIDAARHREVLSVLDA
ncbi:DUF2199 domain-containing protein [Caulobacter sp.]|jgi:hypothetical protein|uniref:DUF2199 domain-containing protein n=1 Tax=Caulobacter sp. TaxID=78 RepID=UPI00161EFA0C